MLGRKELNSSPATLAQVKDILTARSAEPDFGYEQQTCLDYSKNFCKLTLHDAQELTDQLKKIDGLTDGATIKIVDILPQFSSTLLTILAKDKITIDSQKTAEILQLVQKACEKKISPPPKRIEESASVEESEQGEPKKASD